MGGSDDVDVNNESFCDVPKKQITAKMDRDEAKVGEFLGGKVWRSDPSHWIVKSVWVLLAVASLIVVWYADEVLVRMPCSHIRIPFPAQPQRDEDDEFGYHACVRDRRDRFEAYDNLLIQTDQPKGGGMEYGQWCLRVLQQTLGLSPATTTKIVALATIVYGCVLVAMWSLECTGCLIPVQRFLATNNEDCYNDMFSEPRRRRRRCSKSDAGMQSDVDPIASETVWIKRPGNTVSNSTYFVGSILILCSLWRGSEESPGPGETCVSLEDKPIQLEVFSPLSSTPTTFWYSDALFGTMMFVLAVSSTLWHAWNVPCVHYVDLWSMDNSILYLVARHLSLLMFYHASGNDHDHDNGHGHGHDADTDPNSIFGTSMLVQMPIRAASFVLQRPVVTRLAKAINTHPIDVALVTVYMALIIASAIDYFYHMAWKLRYLHGGCGFSVRRRLSSNSNVWTKGHFPIRIREVCAFASLPFLLVGIPLAGLQLLGDDHAFAGSIGTGRIAQRTLVVGWTYRLLERWALDGSPCRSSSNEEKDESDSVTMVIVNAVLSPTAILHWTTGITLIAGYVQARSVEQECLLSQGTSCLR